MPPLRHRSAAHSAPGPYNASVIVISSDEDEVPIRAAKHGHRKHRRPSPERDVFEIVDDSSVKPKEMENLRRQLDKLEQECNTLRKEKSQLSADLKRVEACSDGLRCEICTLHMGSPYTLVDCGHTFCEGCLANWFLTISENRPWDEISIDYAPLRTCPTCRCLVQEPAVQNFAVKRIVSLIPESHRESSNPV